MRGHVRTETSLDACMCMSMIHLLSIPLSPRWHAPDGRFNNFTFFDIQAGDIHLPIVSPLSIFETSSMWFKSWYFFKYLAELSLSSGPLSCEKSSPFRFFWLPRNWHDIAPIVAPSHLSFFFSSSFLIVMSQKSSGLGRGYLWVSLLPLPLDKKPLQSLILISGRVMIRY